MRRNIDKLIYEIAFSIMAIIAVVISVLDICNKINIATDKVYYDIELIIIIIFAVDYVARLLISKDKKSFFKTNIPDLIAIIPFSTFFKLFRVTKLFRLMSFSVFVKLSGITRVVALIAKFNKSIINIVRKNILFYMIIFTLSVLTLGSIAMYIAERNITINSFSESLWWCLLMVTTVGATDITPATVLGKIIAVILMLVGIGTISTLTATVASVVIFRNSASFEHYEVRTLDLSELSDDEFKRVVEFIEFIKMRK